MISPVAMSVNAPASAIAGRELRVVRDHFVIEERRDQSVHSVGSLEALFHC